MLINLQDKVYSIGLMSGTSLDGIDVCLASHENNHHELIAFRSYPYSESLKHKILKASKLDSSNVQLICSLNKELGIAYVDAILKFIEDTNTNIDDIAFIANHGQTIWHNPDMIDGTYPSTLQIGDASYISYKLNKTVVDVGGEFSFNKTVGERTERNGFKSAKIIVNGEFVDGVGGGVCHRLFHPQHCHSQFCYLQPT